jgi:hypothetical protein
MYLKQLFTILSLSILISCAGTQESSDDGLDNESVARDDCIHEPSIRGYRVLDEQNLIVDATGRRSYHVVLWRRAHGLRSTWGIAFDSTTSRVCPGFSQVMFRGHFDGESIQISSIRELTPEDEEALLIQFGKKEPEIEHTPEPADVEGADVEELDPAASE